MKRNKHVTLSILWEEYAAQHPDGYRYSRFCELYRSWEGKLPVTMRQSYVAGEKLFVDYVGDTVPVIVDRLTGEVRDAQIFVAVLGASSLTYAQATWTQTVPDWIDAHCRAFAAIGGVPHLLVAGQHQGGGHPRLFLRPAGQPHLYRDGGVLAISISSQLTIRASLPSRIGTPSIQR